MRIILNIVLEFFFQRSIYALCAFVRLRSRVANIFEHAMTPCKFVFFCLCLFWSVLTYAQEKLNPIQFELAKLAQNEFVALSQWRNKAVIVHFWSMDCPPCIRELPALNAFAETAQIPVIAIALDSRRDAHAFANKQAAKLVHLAAPARPQGLLARLGNRKGALPFTAMLYSNHSLCKTHAGEVDAAWLAATTRQCQ